MRRKLVQAQAILQYIRQNHDRLAFMSSLHSLCVVLWQHSRPSAHRLAHCWRECLGERGLPCQDRHAFLAAIRAGAKKKHCSQALKVSGPLQMISPGAYPLSMTNTPITTFYRKFSCNAVSPLVEHFERFLRPALNLKEMSKHFPLKFLLSICK